MQAQTAVSVLVCGLFKLPYFYFTGFSQRVLVFGSIPQRGSGSAATPDRLHVFTPGVLFPKVLGKRLKLNPLVVTIALFIRSWIWGAMGLILAIPITGAMKIIFDHIDSLRPFGMWLEE
jgi:hypothetical protein